VNMVLCDCGCVSIFTISTIRALLVELTQTLAVQEFVYYSKLHYNFWHIIFNVLTDARIKKMYYNRDVHIKK
jgi:hypothetical protein